TDDGNSLVTREPGPSERVQRARDGLHERGVGDVEAGGQRHEADVLDRELVGHAAVAGEAVEPRDDAPALAHLARGTPVALTARRERPDRDRAAVVEVTGDLVPERDAQRAPGEHVQVGTADPGRSHLHAYAPVVAARAFDVEDLDPVLGVPDGAHLDYV